MFDLLKNKNAIITGVASGLGFDFGMVKLFAGESGRVYPER